MARTLVTYEDGTIVLYSLKQREHAFRVATLIEASLGVEAVIVRRVNKETGFPGLAMYLTSDKQVIHDGLVAEARNILLQHQKS